MKDFQKDNDKLYRYLFKDRAVRGEWVRLNKTFNETLNTHNYPKPVQNLLGEMLVATALLTATLKFEGNITLQVQGDGPVNLAVVNGSDQQQLRAVARIQNEATITDDMTLLEMVGKGVLVITISPKEGERYQGVIGLDKATLRECLEEYFVRSEQLETQLLIYTGEYEGEAVAAGMLLQIMPDGTGEKTDFEHLTTLAATTKNDEIFGLSAEEMLYRLFHEETVEIFLPQVIAFHCGCSEERSGAALLFLSDDEIEKILTEHNGSIDIQCECCGTHYIFDKIKIEQLKAESK